MFNMKCYRSVRIAVIAMVSMLFSTQSLSAAPMLQTAAGSPEQAVTVKDSAKPIPSTVHGGASSVVATLGSVSDRISFAGNVFPGSSVDVSTAPALPLKGKTIVVNAGHGGRDSGAVYAGVMEKTLTLKIALKVRDLLEELGARVVMTRTEDVDMPLAQIDSVTSKIRPDAFLSIHCNAGHGNMRGIESFYFYPESSHYATLMLHTVAGRLGEKANFTHYNNLYVIDHTRVPATLVEVGYLSNKSDRSYLTKDEGQDAIAEALAEGEVKFFSGAKL